MSDVKLSGPHTDLPAPNCDGRWKCVDKDCNTSTWNVTMQPYPLEHGGPVPIDEGDKWTLLSPADSQSPAVPADRPAPDREDGSYTKPAWSGWWIPSKSLTNGRAYYITVTDGVAHYGADGESVFNEGWRPAPIADPSEVEKLKAELAASEARRKADRETANREWQKCGYALDDAGIPIGDGAVYSRIGVLATQRDEARAALEAERAQLAGPETTDVTRLIELFMAIVAVRHGDAECRLIENLIVNAISTRVEHGDSAA